MKKRLLLLTFIMVLLSGTILGLILPVRALELKAKEANPEEIGQWYRSSKLFGDKLNDIIFEKNMFVAIGANGTINTSEDGQLWVKRASGTVRELKQIIWTGKKFIAVGSKGTIITSTDGIEWKAVASNTELDIYSLDYNGKVFVAVGERNLIMTSPDGNKWTLVQSAKPLVDKNTYSVENTSVVGMLGVDFKNIEWCKDKFVIATIHTPSKFEHAKDALITSTDGQKWSLHQLESEMYIRKIMNIDDKIIACTSEGVAISSDGLQWSSVKLPSTFNASINDIIMSNDKYLAIGAQGDVFESSDLKDWSLLLNTQRNLGTGTILNAIAYGNGIYAAVGDNELIALTNDGQYWRTAKKGFGNINDIAYNGDTYVICGKGFIFASKGGAVWDQVYDTRGYQLTSVSWVNNRFFAVGHGYILTSLDGYDWTRVDDGVLTTKGIYEMAQSIAWNSSVYVISAQSSILVSKDGSSWDKIDLSESIGYVRNVVWDGNKFAFITEINREMYIATSADGASWSLEPCKVPEEKETTFFQMYLAYGDSHYVMMKGRSIYYSQDGYNWEKTYSLNKDVNNINLSNHVTHLKWDGSYFVASLWDGMVLMSKDGREWVEINTGYTNTINNAICDGKGFYAVGNYGLLLSSYNPMEALNKTLNNDDSEQPIKIGEYVQFGNYYGEPILWRVINIDGNGDPMLFADNIIAIKAFDAAGDYHVDSSRKAYGSNYWKDSNIRQWLNSKDNNISWIQNTPTKENVWQNPYSEEKGFLADGNFTEADRKAIKPINHRVVLSEVDKAQIDGGSEPLKNHRMDYYYDKAYYMNLVDSVFLLSAQDIRRYVSDRGWDMRAYPTAKAALNSVEAYSSLTYDTFYLNSNEYWWYWLSTPSNMHESVYITDCDNEIKSGSVLAALGTGGVRPALLIDMSSVVLREGSGTKDKPFIIGGIELEAGASDGASLEKPDSWAEKEVYDAISKSLVPVVMQNGYRSNITREDFCSLVLNLISVKTQKSIDAVIAERGMDLSQNPFADTANQAVIAANKLGIVNGRGNGIFDPSGKITRQEAAVMLANTARIFNTDSEASKADFTDGDEISSWAKESVDYVYTKGIMSGVGNNMFSPGATYTRQQAFITILRLYRSL